MRSYNWKVICELCKLLKKKSSTYLSMTSTTLISFEGYVNNNKFSCGKLQVAYAETKSRFEINKTSKITFCLKTRT